MCVRASSLLIGAVRFLCAFAALIFSQSLAFTHLPSSIYAAYALGGTILYGGVEYFSHRYAGHRLKETAQLHTAHHVDPHEDILLPFSQGLPFTVVSCRCVRCSSRRSAHFCIDVRIHSDLLAQRMYVRFVAPSERADLHHQSHDSIALAPKLRAMERFHMQHHKDAHVCLALSLRFGIGCLARLLQLIALQVCLPWQSRFLLLDSL
jgi:hypothetical protein